MPTVKEMLMNVALLYGRLSMPKNLDAAFGAIAAAMEGNYTKLGRLTLYRLQSPAMPRAGDLARQLISCVDHVPYDAHRPQTWPTADELTNEALRQLKTVSRRFALR